MIELSRRVIDLADLPMEMIFAIAADSYRARQLMRLTCKSWCDMLTACSHFNKVRCLMNRRLYYSYFDDVHLMLGGSAERGVLAYKLYVDGDCIRDMALMRGTTTGIRVSVHKYSTGQYICAIQIPMLSVDQSIQKYHASVGLEYTHCDIRFFNRDCRLLSFGNVCAERYIHDTLPELYQRITFK
jgi:hypothetical protein